MTLSSVVLLIMLLLVAAHGCTATSRPIFATHGARKLVLVPTPKPSMTYHGGSLLTGPRPLRLHLLWYGSFSSVTKSAVSDFIASIYPPKAAAVPRPSAASWWRTVRRYHDGFNVNVTGRVILGASAYDVGCRLGKNLTAANLATLVRTAITFRALPRPPFPGNGYAVYVVITAADVVVEDFCMNTCGSHSAAAPLSKRWPYGIPFIWVGNAASQCLGLCAWPYAVPEYGPPGPPLKAPSGDAATDGVIINLASLLAGATTNPFGNGYYEGDAAVPEEAATACDGVYGKGSYPGYPGELLVDRNSGASYNAHGVNGRQFLLPAIWSPATGSCQPPV